MEKQRDLAGFLVFWATKVQVYLRSICRDFWNLRFFRTREISTNAVFRRALKYWDVYTKIRAEKIENYSFFKKTCKTTFSADSNICGKCLYFTIFLYFGFVGSRTTIWKNAKLDQTSLYKWDFQSFGKFDQNSCKFAHIFPIKQKHC